MKRLIILFVVVLAAVGFMSCGGKNDVTDPSKKEDPKKEDVLPGNDYVVYEANEKIFAATDALKAIDARLGEIEALGVNVLWLMPIHPVGVEKTANSPYCVRDYKAVHPAYGTIDDLRTLVQHAHDRKMKVILDWIANHTALDHQWVKDHPDWYTKAQTGDEKNWPDVTFLNYSKPEVRAAMIDALTYWVKEADIDGFRCDYAQGVPDDFWKEAITAIRAVKPSAIMLAETSRTELYTAGFDWLYSWNYLANIQDLYGKGSLAALYSASAREFDSTPAGKQRLRYVTNHDASSEKANSALYTSPKGMLAASCLTYFLGGIPLIYSSQEIGYMKSINFCVTPAGSVRMNWNENPDILEHTKDLMGIYHATAKLRGGKQELIQSSEDVACITYTSDAGTLAVLVNIRNKEVNYSLPMLLQNREVTDQSLCDGVKLGRTLTLPAYGYKIYKW